MELTYKVKRSPRRRSLTITVERDRAVIVHAPDDAPDEAIEQAVASKRQWIYEKLSHPQKYHGLPHPPGKELVNGESALYLGRQYRIELVSADMAKVELAQRFLIPKQEAAKRADAMKEWYIGKANERIIPRVMQHARQLGVDVTRIRIVDNHYRWGSCTPTGNISLNWRLIKAPMFVIDYVIVHELAHLIEANHTPVFWNTVRAQAPTMDKARAWLKENGQMLEQTI